MEDSSGKRKQRSFVASSSQLSLVLYAAAVSAFIIFLSQMHFSLTSLSERVTALETISRLYPSTAQSQPPTGVSYPALPTPPNPPTGVASPALLSPSRPSSISLPPVTAISAPGGEVVGNFLTEHLKKIPNGKLQNFAYGAHPKEGFKDGDPIPHTLFGPPIDSNGKIVFPSHIKRIKLDVGLSWNAPNSDDWLTKFKDMAVIGVEPSIYNLMSVIRLSYKKWSWDKGPDERRFYVVPTAVDDGPLRMAKFYQGPGDGGTSSLNEFKSGSSRFEAEVPTLHLSSLVDAIPEDRFPYIEHIKTDTQGNDVKVLKSLGDRLTKRVVYYSAEPGEYEKNQYKTSHDGQELEAFMADNGFELVKKYQDAQWTYLNKAFKNHPDLSKMDYFCA